jgi:DNA-binding SARP family transcriptional activator
LTDRNLSHLWFQVDAGDHDSATFFYFLGLAARKRRRPLPLLTPEYRQGLPTFTRNFFREFFGRFKSPVTLVFDNYQEVSADSDLNHIMPVALAELPNGARAIFISRSEPPPSFAPLRAKQAIELLDWSEIKFNRTEANGMLRRLTPGRWSNKLVDRFHHMTDGWAAGLVLLAEQGKRDSERDTAVPGISSQLLFNYFASEIFKQMDGETKDVLLQTAFLERSTPTVAEELTGFGKAGEILAQLHRQNYFTNRRAGTQPHYEYHPLFREFLLAEAKRLFTIERQAEICRRAAGILAGIGQIEAAAPLYGKAQDWSGFANLIRQHAPALVSQGRLQTLLEWLSRIPESTLDDEPWLLYWRAVCQHGHRFAESRRDAERAIKGFRLRNDAVGAYTAWSTAVFSILYEAQDARQFDFWIALIDELRREFPIVPSEAVEAYVACGMLVIITWRRHRHPDADYWRQRAFILAQRNAEPVLSGQLWTTLICDALQRGAFAEVQVMIAELQKVARTRDAPPIARAAAYMGLAWSWLTGDTTIGLASFQEGIPVSLGVGFGSTASGLYAVGSACALSAGDRRLAAECLTAVERELDHAPTGYVIWFHRNALWLDLLRGDMKQAGVKANHLLNICSVAGWAHDEASSRLVALQALHECGETDRALAQAARVLELAAEMDSPFFEFMARLAEAQIAFDQQKDKEGLDALRNAVTLGRKGEYCASYGWRPTVMAKLCARALEAGLEVDYVRRLIVQRQLVPEEPVEIEVWPWPVKIYTLGRFAVHKNEQPLTFGHKVQRKPLALLKAIIAYGGQNVHEEELLDLLWPDADGDAARIALNSATHRLRKLLGREETIQRKDNRISLNERSCWVDAFAVERLLRQAETYSASDERSRSQAVQTVRRAAALYRGSFSEPEVAAADALSDRLRRRLLTQLLRVGADAEKLEQWQDAVNFYEQGLNADPTSEATCRRLMNLYHQLGRRADALGIYNQCRQAMKQRLGTTPSTETEALLKRITSTHS